MKRDTYERQRKEAILYGYRNWVQFMDEEPEEAEKVRKEIMRDDNEVSLW